MFEDRDYIILYNYTYVYYILSQTTILLCVPILNLNL